MQATGIVGRMLNCTLTIKRTIAYETCTARMWCAWWKLFNGMCLSFTQFNDSFVTYRIENKVSKWIETWYEIRTLIACIVSPYRRQAVWVWQVCECVIHFIDLIFISDSGLRYGRWHDKCARENFRRTLLNRSLNITHWTNFRSL